MTEMNVPSEPESLISPEILIPKQNVIRDSQILTTLQGCARLTDFRFNMHLVSAEGKPSFFAMGSVVHKFLEVYYGSQINGINKQDSKGFAHIAAVEEIQSNGNLSPEEIELALKTCEEYLDYYKNDYWIPLEVETVHGEVLYEDDEIRILYKAKLDYLVDTLQGIYAVDHKTMKQRRETLSLNNQFMGQCVLTKSRGMFVNKIGFQKTLKPSEKFTRELINYSADRLAEWQQVILPYYGKTLLMYRESGYWPPNFNHCDKYYRCAFYDVCTADRNMREEILGQQFIVGEQWDVLNE
jgi:hypothetical protein